MDLALEGPAVRVSRQQARLVLRAPGRHTLTNTGRRALTVNNRRARAPACAACTLSPAPSHGCSRWAVFAGGVSRTCSPAVSAKCATVLVALPAVPGGYTNFVGNVLIRTSCMCVYLHDRRT